MKSRLMGLSAFIWLIAVGGTCALADEPTANPDAEALQKISKYYMRPLTDDEAKEKTLAGLLSKLDKHSSYMSPGEFAARIRKGPYVGIGISLKKDEQGEIEIVSSIEKGPAEKAGLKPGDRITAIDGQAVNSLPLAKVFELFKGELGSSVRLTIRSHDTNALSDVTLQRAQISIPSVVSRRIGNVGYLRIISLNDQADEELRSAILAFRASTEGDVGAYILDLRNDPGGLLDAGASVSSEFLPSGTIMFLRGRPNSQTDNQVFKAQRSDLTNGKPLIVLINEGTAAGAEIIAGAMQDNGRAKVIGMRSFGNASVQTIIPLSNGGALRLTTAQIYLPSGRSFEDSGIEPDILVSRIAIGKDSADGAALSMRPAGGPPAFDQSKVKYPPAGTTTQDFQLDYALSLLQSH